MSELQKWEDKIEELQEAANSTLEGLQFAILHGIEKERLTKNRDLLCWAMSALDTHVLALRMPELKQTPYWKDAMELMEKKIRMTEMILLYLSVTLTVIGASSDSLSTSNEAKGD